MRIGHDLRVDAAAFDVGEHAAVEIAMKEKAAEFVAGGSEIYS